MLAGCKQRLKTNRNVILLVRLSCSLPLFIALESCLALRADPNASRRPPTPSSAPSPSVTTVSAPRFVPHWLSLFGDTQFFGQFWNCRLHFCEILVSLGVLVR
jgi:hypothetical protein